MSDYTKTVDFAAKDGLSSGNASKIVKGTEIDTEFDNIATAIATKYDSTDRGAASGIASLDGSTLILAAELPAATTSAKGGVELATDGEATTGTDTGRAVTPANVKAIHDQNIGALTDLIALTDPSADRIVFYDNSGTAIAWLTVGTGLAISATTLTSDDANIDHDSLSNFVANEHIDHTAVTLTAGTGLTGGGDISANRSFNLDISGLSSVEGNGLVAADGFLVDNGGAMERMAYSDTGVPVTTETGTSDTLATADMNTMVEYTNASAVTVTLNTGVGKVGNVVLLKQSGAGTVTVAGSATVETAIGQSTSAQHSVMALLCIAADTWALFGDAV